MRLLLATLALVSLVGAVSARALQAQRLSALGSDWMFKVQSATGASVAGALACEGW